MIASRTKLVIRQSRKFTAGGFLQSLLSSVATGLASLNQIVGDLKDRNHPGMARQSLHQRFGTRSTAFLMGVLCDLMQQRYSAAASAAAFNGSEIQRILIEDASGQVMPKSGDHHMQALVLAAMIAHQLGMRIAQRIGGEVGRARLSYEKLYDLLAVRLIKARTLAEVAAFDPDPRHVQRDKRTRKSPIESGILALT